MSMRSMYVAFAAVVVVTPMILRAQDVRADFPRAHAQFVAGQTRDAAQTLLTASVLVRQEVGRSRDEVVGMKLYDAEGQLEKLAASVKAGALTSVKTLDKALIQIDRVLAQHHLQVASAAIAEPRNAAMTIVARDIDRAAFHFERSITLDGRSLSPEQVTATADARTLAKKIEDTKSIPKEAQSIVATLEKLVVGATSAVVAY